MNQKTINDEYFSDLPHSFGGEYRLINKFGKENKNLIQDALGENDIYTRFKQFKKLRYYSPIYVYRKRQLLQADIVFFNKKIQEKDWSRIMMAINICLLVLMYLQNLPGLFH